MKKYILVIFIFISLIFLCSCEENNGHYEECEIKVVNKETATESKYNWFLDKYKIYTAYYIVLENGEVIECDVEEYMQYQIGDTYTVKVWVEDPKQAEENK